MESLRELLATIGLANGALGADNDGYQWIIG